MALGKNVTCFVEQLPDLDAGKIGTSFEIDDLVFYSEEEREEFRNRIKSIFEDTFGDIMLVTFSDEREYG